MYHKRIYWELGLSEVKKDSSEKIEILERRHFKFFHCRFVSSPLKNDW